eukprot:gene2187-1355_t
MQENNMMMMMIYYLLWQTHTNIFTLKETMKAVEFSLPCTSLFYTHLSVGQRASASPPSPPLLLLPLLCVRSFASAPTVSSIFRGYLSMDLVAYRGMTNALRGNVDSTTRNEKFRLYTYTSSSKK